MKLVCAPEGYPFPPAADGTLHVVLFGRADDAERGSAGAAIKDRILREWKLAASPRAWDFLSLALAVVTADLAGHRDRSPDGWTREFDLDVAVADPEFWNAQRTEIEVALAFLTTDRWQVRFVDGGFRSNPPQNAVRSAEDCVLLLSGGLDSLVGAIDLVAAGRSPIAVSHVVRGDAEKQELFARSVGARVRHLQINHNADAPDPEAPPSQRARSVAFIAYGVLIATSMGRWHAGDPVPLYICENGFISLNPPLTGARIGSLSTRTTHPVFLGHIHNILDAAQLRVQLVNPYQVKTKGEMLIDCADQALLKSLAMTSTSCGRFGHYGYKHCGRCVPCQVRRAAFLKWGVADTTGYVFENLGTDDEHHAGFDDVRSAAMAVAEVQSDGLDAWLGNALSTVLLDDVAPLKAVVARALAEIAALHRSYGVK